MYESFYGFREKPFSLIPDPEFFYRSSNHRAALSLLEYGLFNRSGFIVITGEIGTGKSLLLRKMMGEAGQELTIGLISNTHGNFQSLMPWMMGIFNLRPRSRDQASVHRKFAEFLDREHALKRRVVLVVDEAQNLEPSMLEELRLLSNMNSGKDPILQIVLSGQPGLRDLLRRSDMIQFAQRIDAEYHLEPMNAEETDRYIHHRVKTAGREIPLFEEEAFSLIYRISGGVPRLINQACERSLVYGFAEQAERISARLVAEAASDRIAGRIIPFVKDSGLTSFLNGRERPVRDQEGNGEWPTHRSERSGSAEASGKASGMAYQKGMELKEAGRRDEAVPFFEKAAEDPAYWMKASFLAGLCHREAGRSDEALKLFRRALSDYSAPGREVIRVRYEMGCVLEEQGKIEEALDCFQRVRFMERGFGDVADRIERLTESMTLRQSRLVRFRKRLKGLARALLAIFNGSLQKFNQFLISR
ncbi:MAG TPA: AAA family ATPase [Nitrospiria bacterium]|nr:AAA family ATPase [Nitrospiria bacterium]